VAQVDLELAPAVFVRGGDRTELELNRGVEQPCQRAVRVGQVADGVDGAVVARVGPVATRPVGVGLAQLELELGADDRVQAELRELGEHALERAAAVERVRLVGDRILEVDEARDHVLLPRQRNQRVQIGSGQGIGEAVLETLLSLTSTHPHRPRPRDPPPAPPHEDRVGRLPDRVANKRLAELADEPGGEETILQTTPYAGIPRAVNAMKMLREEQEADQ